MAWYIVEKEFQTFVKVAVDADSLQEAESLVFQQGEGLEVDDGTGSMFLFDWNAYPATDAEIQDYELEG